MQFVRVTSAAAVFLIFGTIAPAYARQERGGKPAERPQAAPAQQQRAQAQPQQQHAPAARQPQPQQRAQQPQPQRAQPQQQHAQPAPKAAPQQARQPQQQHAQPAPKAAPQQARQQPQQQHAQPAPNAAPQQARQPQQQHAQPAQQAKQQQARQQPQQQQQPQRTEKQAVAWQQQRGFAPKGSWQGHSTFQQDRSQNWASDHRTWAQRGGYGGYYIPQDRFNLSFGSQHWFRMVPTMYLGYPRFSYGGFSFLLVDPYPESWALNWYSTDDVYIGYDNGYYLYDRRYPGVGLAVTVDL